MQPIPVSTDASAAKSGVVARVRVDMGRSLALLPSSGWGSLPPRLGIRATDAEGVSAPWDTAGGVHLYPRLGPVFLSPPLIRHVASDLVDVGSPTSGRPSPPQAITVVTVDGDPLARRALRSQLAAESDLDLVGEAADASTGVDLVSEQQPDLVLIAVTTRDQHSSYAIGEMVKASPHTRIIVLALERDEDPQMQLLRAGAVGWLMKSVDLEVLPRVLRGVHAGEAAVPRALSKRVVAEAIGNARTDRNRLRPIRSALTRREWEVVDLLAEGATTAGLARDCSSARRPSAPTSSTSSESSGCIHGTKRYAT